MSSHPGLDLITDDDRVRPCRVKLYQRPILGPLASHWALYFRWEDGYDLHCEGLDVDGILKPSCERGKPERNPDSEVTDIETLDHLSPKRVNRRALRNRRNGKPYNYTKMNCQGWAKQLASDLGFDIKVSENIAGLIPGSEVVDVVYRWWNKSGSSKKSSKDK
ncbi:uncharacterized protein [Macrobrachium rosenbergii]|uniref:uncharacterized protein isoform X3 n=1 Tax=Macrobrachium rosenbergii TaxID=79674 RepID=UPI0034D482EA